VAESQLLDQLWPDSEADAARKSLDMTVHRLRALLGGAEYVLANDGCIGFDRNRVWVDASMFEELTRDGADKAERAARLYRGVLLPEEIDSAWSVSYREKLRDSFNRLVCAQAAAFESRQEYQQALNWYAHGLETDDLVEAMYQGIMRCQMQLERSADALATFQRLRRTLAAKLRALPSPESAALAAAAQAQ
jgi:LuxR family transcriptional regulator, maltose regulon positive regulatory protein